MKSIILTLHCVLYCCFANTSTIAQVQVIKLRQTINHSDEINSASFSPDGKYFATASDDKTAKIWETRTGKLAANLLGHTKGVNSVKFSPDGKYVISASWDGTAKAWETITGKLVWSLSGQKDERVWAALFSPDGKYIVTTSGEMAKVWEAVTGKFIGNLIGHSNKIISVSFSPDGKYVATASWDETAKIWDIDTGRMVSDLIGHADDVRSAMFSPDGKYVVTASEDNAAKIWNTATGKLMWDLTGHTEDIMSATFSPNGKYVVTSSWDETAKIWETVTGKLLWDLKGHTNWVHSAAFSPNGKYIATTSSDNTAKIWETATGKWIWNLTGHTSSVHSAVFSPDGNYIITTSSDKTAKIWEMLPIPTSITSANLEVKSISFSDKNGNNNNVLDANEKTTIDFVVFNTGKGSAYNLIAEAKALHIVNGIKYPNQYQIGHLAGGESIVVSIPVSATTNVESGVSEFEVQIKEGNGFNSKPIQISFHVQKLITTQVAREAKLIRTIKPIERYSYESSFSSDKKYFVTLSDDNIIKIWETVTDKLIWNLTGHSGLIHSVEFSPEGKYIVSSDKDKSVKIWETSTGKLVGVMTSNGYKPEISPDGKYIALKNYEDYTTEIWEMATVKLISNLTGFFKEFSPDGNHIVTEPLRDKTVLRVWETSTGKSLWNLTSTGYEPTFSPNGKYIVTKAKDNTAKIWETATGKLLWGLTGAFDEFSPDGKYIVTRPNDRDNEIAKIMEASSGKLVLTGGYNIEFSPDGKYIVIVQKDKTVKIVEAATQKLWNVDSGILNNVIGATPDLKYLLVKENDITARIIETTTQKSLWSLHLTSHPDITPDGKYIVTQSEDKTAKIWEIATGKLIGSLRLTEKNDDIRSLMFTPDGVHVIVAGNHVEEIWRISAPRPTAPANLEIKSIFFSDKNGNSNNVLDANEKAHIGFTITNTGKGLAHNLFAEIKSINTIVGIEYPSPNQLGNLASGESNAVNIPLSASMNVESGAVNFEIKIKEENGFDSDPVRISFNVQRFRNPQVTIADFKFSTEGGKIKLGQLIALEIILQNKGQGDASNIRISFSNPQNVFPASETNFAIAQLKPNENQKLVYEFFANKMYTDKEIPVEVSVTEDYNHYGDKRTLSVSLEQTLSQAQTVTIAGQVMKPVQIEIASLKSEVDTNIPSSEKIYSNRYALVIGNEDYKKYQMGLHSDQNVLFARNDALVFREYLIKTLGVPEKQTFMLTDATRAQMSRELERITQLVKMTPNAELVFYYAGHGLPDIETQQGYLIPVDVTAANLKDAISLKELYSKLASSKASKTLVFLDACFSGGGRGENGLLAARTVKVKPKGDIIEGNIVAFTASSGEEVSLPLNKEYHGLFTYYVLRKLKDTQGDLSLEQLKDYLEREIPKASLIENGMRQTPQVLTAPDLNDKWLSWKFQN